MAERDTTGRIAADGTVRGGLVTGTMPLDEKGGPGRVNNSDLLRLIFASWVIVHHFATLSNFGYSGIFFNLGHSSVLGFFVISGFLIYWSYDKGRDFGTYAVRRAFRIYPLYLVAIALQVIVFMQIVPPNGLSELGRYIAANLVFLNFVQPSFGDMPATIPSDLFNGSLWTIKIEVFFYAMVPFFLLLPGQRFWAVMMFIASTLWFLHFAYNAENPKLATQIPPGQLRFFAVGILLYLAMPFKNLSQRGVIGLFAACLLVFGTSEYLKEFKTGPQWLEALFVTLDPISIGLGVYLVAFRFRPVHIPLDISYGVYLIHYPLYQILMILGIFQDNAPAFFLTVAISTFVLAYLSARYLETPAIRLGQSLAAMVKGRFLLGQTKSGTPIPSASKEW